ncbi:Alpha/beta hydrolase fold-3 domain protein [Pseudarthrobacter chlorophenolicus A6]|uniref:Alpha/beta hydrolase fold-3 domain protein n=1 Tax=Pseudarthrobacter chlorophenolicus (strain ATCC 700700 / DSM 12829 / CIP 107037 / JCM 12360 / KCTC 9906 / NCIMB 13794 / A6) TaxID=452863 RepID=B8HAI7_PSECP|nr:alpha/beta hydrolase [Pseudarthrobacter chlorophenolicus]ACL38448.1 Alpha/beta hydrolase fold-3 domain protein [Pseudarthrobacter chlorophenolicus A6]SDQ48631.1 Acetyl esterase/lipase [Pseudarthrobacter chlorophenolicus]
MTQPTPGGLSGSQHGIITGQNGAVHMESTTTAGRILRGIEFARPDGGAPLLLDLYLPVADPARRTGAPHPAVVHFHGGGWRTGERSSLGPTVDGFGLSPIEQLVDAGFVVASADYRLTDTVTFPAQLHDAKAAVRWLRTHAAAYNVDPGRIYAWGDSAGGHLASLVGLTGGSAAFTDDGGTDPADSVAAVVAWYPPTDLVRMGAQARPDAVARADDPGSREALLIGAQPADAPDKARAASPLAYVHAGAPPFLLIHGTADRFVPAAQSAGLAGALEDAGAAVELLLLDGADHMWATPDGSSAAAETATAATLDFLRRQSEH